MLEVVVPNGLLIGKTAYGKGLFVTKDFAKNETIYTNKVLIVSPGDSFTEFLAINNDGSTTKHELSHTHSVKSASEDRFLYTFDGFYNHSCSPNSVDVPLNEEETEFKMIALRDIKSGEELTCNYLLFDYECDGHAFDNCECGSENCFQNIRGFKNLPYETQVSLLPQVDSAVRTQFMRDHPDFVHNDK